MIARCLVLLSMAALIITGVSFAEPWPDSVIQKMDSLMELEKEKKDMPASIEESPVLNGDEVYKLWKSKKAVIIDTRSKIQYDTEKIAGAQLLPSDELLKDPAVADSLDKEKEYVLYCNGIKCTRSPRTAIMLKHLGFKKLYWYREGMPDWKNKGFPTE